MKPIHVTSNTYIDFNIKKVIRKILNLKLVIMSEYQNIKTFLAKGCLPNWPEEVLLIQKVKNTVPWTNVVINLNSE